jgi:hypothetical protein
MEHTKWKMRDICKSTYFIELDDDEGCISVFAKTPEKAEKTARLIAAAPALLKACEDDAYSSEIAINATCTSERRNRLTEINIQRLAAIAMTQNS